MKIGTKVTFIRRNGEQAFGKVVSELVAGGRGDWLQVDIGEKKAPKLLWVRPSMLKRG